MEELRVKIKDIFGCPVEIKSGIGNLEYAYDSRRKQYFAPTLISYIHSLGRGDDEKVIAITDLDLFAPRLNFIFGEADIGSGTAIVSLCRLRQEYYGLPSNKVLFIERVTKEIVHELGHILGLGHCPDTQCIMHFSNSLADTDYKSASFCPRCHPRLTGLT